MTARAWCVAGGWVRSQSDGDRHYVTATAVARLYGLRQGEWQRHDEWTERAGCARLRHLGPRRDGQYVLPTTDSPA